MTPEEIKRLRALHASVNAEFVTMMVFAYAARDAMPGLLDDVERLELSINVAYAERDEVLEGQATLRDEAKTSSECMQIQLRIITERTAQLAAEQLRYSELAEACAQFLREEDHDPLCEVCGMCRTAQILAKHRSEQ